jgi:hypothetical protein
MRQEGQASETWIERLKERAEEDLTAIELFISKIAPYLPSLKNS